MESVCYSPDGTKILTGSSESTKIWDAKFGMELLDLKGKSGVRASYSPDGKRIVTVADDNRSKVGGGWDLKRQYNTVKLWDAKTGISLRELSGQIGFVQSVSFSPDSRRFVTGGFRVARLSYQVAGLGLGRRDRFTSV